MHLGTGRAEGGLLIGILNVQMNKGLFVSKKEKRDDELREVEVRRGGC